MKPNRIKSDLPRKEGRGTCSASSDEYLYKYNLQKKT